MLILNINGPINAGKTTVSKILARQMENAVFIEVDDLLSEAEQTALGLSMVDGWAERQKRLNARLVAYKMSRQYDTVIFAYPIGENSYREWAALADENTRFLNVTLAPTLEKCVTNRGKRSLTDWEISRIKEMYAQGYHHRPYADLIVNNDAQTPDETARVIMDFVAHTQCPEQQWLHLVTRRWPALLKGEKTSTFRLNEGFVHPGFLVYKDYPDERAAAVVYVQNVYYVPLRQAIALDGFDDHTPNETIALKQMRVHYPDITLDTPVLLARHLSVPETLGRYPEQVQRILEKVR